MEKTEFAVLADAIRTYYPKENILPNKEAMKLWYQELQDIPYDVAVTALRKWVSTNKWSPSIADIREYAVDVSEGKSLTWGDSWERVVKAIRRYGQYNAKAALESLDPLTRTCVENLGYRELCISENPMQDRANYRMIFEIMEKREKERKQLALPLQESIQMIQMKQIDNSMYLLGGGNNDD